MGAGPSTFLESSSRNLVAPLRLRQMARPRRHEDRRERERERARASLLGTKLHTGVSRKSGRDAGRTFYIIDGIINYYFTRHWPLRDRGLAARSRDALVTAPCRHSHRSWMFFISSHATSWEVPRARDLVLRFHRAKS